MADNKKTGIFLDKQTFDDIRELSKLLGVSTPKLLSEAIGLLTKRYKKVLDNHRIAGKQG